MSLKINPGLNKCAMLTWRVFYRAGALRLTFTWWANRHHGNRRAWRRLQDWLQLDLIGALLLGWTLGLTWVWCCSCHFISGRRAARYWCCYLGCGAGPRGGAAATHRASFHQEKATTVLRRCADGKKHTTDPVYWGLNKSNSQLVLGIFTL